MNCKMFEIIRNSKQEVKMSNVKELSTSVGVLALWMHVHSIYRVIQNDCRGFNNLSYTIHLRQEYIVFTDGSRNSESFLLRCAVCSSYAFLRLERSLLDGGERRTADMLQTVWNELDFRVDVCRITKGVHIEHL